MKNVMVANFPNDPSKGTDLLKMLVAQIENSIELGWSRDDIIVVANRELDLPPCRFFNCDLNTMCMTGSKVFGLNYIFQNSDIDDVFWLHDLDAWQNHPFTNLPNIRTAGFCHYSRPKINGGSQFWVRGGAQLLQTICDEITSNRANKEEPVIQRLCSGRSDVTILNSTFNVGCSGYTARFSSARRPILVSHFHPTNRIAWQTHALDRDGRGMISISDRLERLLRRHFNLAFELDDEGREAQTRKILQRG